MMEYSIIKATKYRYKPIKTIPSKLSGQSLKGNISQLHLSTATLYFSVNLVIFLTHLFSGFIDITL